MIGLVIKTLLQLLVQSILVYVVLGPGEGEDSSTAGKDSLRLLNMFMKKLQTTVINTNNLFSTLYYSSQDKTPFNGSSEQFIFLHPAFREVCLDVSQETQNQSSK